MHSTVLAFPTSQVAALITAAVTAGLVVGCSSRATSAPVDTLFVNGRFVTLGDPARAEAISVRAGQIVAVGTFEEVLAAGGVTSQTRRIDLAGRTILPGLIDAHGHLAALGLRSEPDHVDASGAASAQEVARRVGVIAQRSRDTNRWVVGRDWDQNRWTAPAAGQFPTAGVLDEVCPDRPVMLTRVDGHALWVNSAALRLSGIDASTPDPPGGRILRDADNRPTGVLIDKAMTLVQRVVPPESPPLLRDRMLRALTACAAAGLTCVHDAGLTRETYAALKSLASENRLPIRVYGMADARDGLAGDLLASGPLLEANGRLTLRAVKLYADGALGSRGAALIEPYADDPANRGLLILSADEISARAAPYLDRGLQVCVHAIGDAANRAALDAFERLLADKPLRANTRPRIEHAQVLDRDDLNRFARLGVIASVQPTHAVSDWPWAVERLGPHRLAGAYAYNSLREAGAALAGGSDFPVEPLSPFLGLRAACSRQTLDNQPPDGWLPHERLPLSAALRLFTSGAAYAGFAENHLGSLAPGRRADFVVLDRNILELPDSQLHEVQVLKTYVDGQPVYSRPGEP